MPLTQARDKAGRAVPYVFTKTAASGEIPTRTTAAAYYTRIRINGRWTTRKLKAAALSHAATEAQTMRHKQANALALDLPDPLAKQQPAQTVGDLVRKYRAAGCPDKANHPTGPTQRAAAGKRLDQLLKYWSHHTAATGVTLAECDRYHRWRTVGAGRVTRGAGHRIVDMELGILSNVLTWAARADHIPHNPIAQRPRYHRGRDVNHCTGRMPATDDELHTLAARLLTQPRAAALGWQLLFEALTGCRTGEILALRMDAAKHGHTADPGYVDDHALWIHRAKKGIFPWILLQCADDHAPLADLLQAHTAWHTTHHPGSPWYFPSWRDDTQHVDKTSLSHALARECKSLGINHISSHGLRAYHVRALRSLGIDDSEIAKRLGQRSGVSLVETTYGVSEPGWYNSQQMDFLPDPDGNTPNAWAPWLRAAQQNNIRRVNF